MFFQQLVNGLTLGSVYAVIAIGYTLVFGVLNIVNMAHGGIIMMGAYIGLLLVTVAGWGLFPALIGAMVGGAILGYLLEVLALRPLRGKKVTHLAPLISTIGVSIFLESAALLVFGPQTRAFPTDYNQLMDFGLFKISEIQIISMGTAVVLMVLLTLLLNKTRIGKAVRATAENIETASLLGIHTRRIITFTVMLASALGAAAGVLIALSFNAIEPTMGTSMGFKGLAVLIMGGLGNVGGAMAGGFILGVAEVFSVAYGASSFRDAGSVWPDHPDSLYSSTGAVCKGWKGRKTIMEDILNGYVLQVVIFVCINIILAMTIYMTLCTGLLSLGNAGFMSLGAYTSAILTVQYNLPMPLGILAGGVVAMIVGLIIGLPTTRLRGLYLAIATLGFGEVVRVIALNLDITHGALGFSGIPSMANSLSESGRQHGHHRCIIHGFTNYGISAYVYCSDYSYRCHRMLLECTGTLKNWPCI